MRPSLASVAASQNHAPAPNRPAFVVVQKLNAQQRDVHIRRNHRPGFAAVCRTQQCAALSHCPTIFVVPKIDVIKRHVRGDILLRPTRAFIAREQDRAAIADNPTAFVTDEVDMDQLQAARSALPPPTLATIVRLDENAIHYTIFLTDRPDPPALLLARKTHAEQLDVGAFEFLGRKDSRLRPTATVAGDEDGVAGEKKSGFLVTEIDVVYAGFS